MFMKRTSVLCRLISTKKNMLVSESTAKRWYNTNSFFFKNFSLLFSNKLWQNRVPEGFAICPYFWLSLFSFFVFQPFFYVPITRMLMPAAKCIGNLTDNKLAPACKRVGINFKTVYFGLLFISIISVLIGTHTIISVHPAGTILFWSFVSCFVLVGVRLALDHFSSKHYACSDYHYLYTVVWGALSLGAVAIFCPECYVELFTSTIPLLASAVWEIIALLAWFVGWVFSNAVVWLSDTLGFLVLPAGVILAAVGILSGLVILFDKLLSGVFPNHGLASPEAYTRKPDYYDSWFYMFTKLLMSSEQFDKFVRDIRDIEILSDSACYNMPMQQMNSHPLVYDLAQEIVKEYFWEVLADLRDVAPLDSKKLKCVFTNGSNSWDSQCAITKVFGTTNKHIRALLAKLPSALEKFREDAKQLRLQLHYSDEKYAVYWTMEKLLKADPDLFSIDPERVYPKDIWPARIAYFKCGIILLWVRLRRAQENQDRWDAYWQKLEDKADNWSRKLDAVSAFSCRLLSPLQPLHRALQAAWGRITTWFKHAVEFFVVFYKLLVKGKNEVCPYFRFEQTNSSKKEPETKEDN